MKINLKFIAIISLFSAMLVGCEKDLYENIINNDVSNAKVSIVTISELSNDPEFLKIYGRIGKLKVCLKDDIMYSKTSLENKYGFTIIDSTVNMVEYGTKKSYSLLISKDSLPSDQFQNLLVEIKSPTQSKFSIVDYKKSLLNDGSNKIVYYTEKMQDIEFDPKQDYSSQDRKMCISVITIMCTSAPYCGGTNSAAGCSRTTTRYCAEEGGGGGASAGDSGSSAGSSAGGSTGGSVGGSVGSNTGSTGSGNTGGDSDIVAAPVAPPRPPLTPCETLAEAMASGGTVMSQINSLKSGTNSAKESAVRIERRSSPLDGELKMTGIEIQGQNFSTNVTTGGRTVGQGHVHTNDGQSIPSFGDLNWLAECEEGISSYSIGMAFNIVVVKDRANPTEVIIYAVTIANLNLLQQSIANEISSDPQIIALPNKDDQVKAVNDKMSYYFGEVENDPNGMEEKFLKLYRNYAIKLNKFDQDTKQWNTLKLQNPFNSSNPNAPNSVIEEPCN